MEKVAESNTVQLWLTPEQVAEVEYERDQIAAAQSEQQWEQE